MALGGQVTLEISKDRVADSLHRGAARRRAAALQQILPQSGSELEPTPSIPETRPCTAPRTTARLLFRGGKARTAALGAPVRHPVANLRPSHAPPPLPTALQTATFPAASS